MSSLSEGPSWRLIGDGAMGRVTLGGATVEGASAGAKGEADGMGGAYAADGVTWRRWGTTRSPDQPYNLSATAIIFVIILALF